MSPKCARSSRSARTIKCLTAFGDRFIRSAISLADSPSTRERRTTCRYSGVSFSTAASSRSNRSCRRSIWLGEGVPTGTSAAVDGGLAFRASSAICARARLAMPHSQRKNESAIPFETRQRSVGPNEGLLYRLLGIELGAELKSRPPFHRGSEATPKTFRQLIESVLVAALRSLYQTLS